MTASDILLKRKSWVEAEIKNTRQQLSSSQQSVDNCQEVIKRYESELSAIDQAIKKLAKEEG